MSSATNWFNKSKRKSNQYCIYCGRYIGIDSKIPSNREHLIARSFAPNNAQSDSFNFIFRSCSECNSRKSDYERHLSTVSLFNSPARSVDEAIDALAIHKGLSDFHPIEKGKKVADSFTKHNVAFNFGQQVHISFEFIAPPQAADSYVEQLAYMQIQGFFSLITSNPEQSPEIKQYRLLPPEHFHYVGKYNYQDWGNLQLIGLINLTRDWEQLANLSTLDGFFRCKILCNNKNPRETWFWILEWNKFFRVCGFIGDLKEVQSIVTLLPKATIGMSKDENGDTIKFRKEIPLSDSDDHVFDDKKV